MVMHKAHGGRVELQQAVNGFGFQSRGLGQALGSTSGWCAEQHIYLLGLENLENTGDDGGFTHPRPTGDHGDFTPQGHRHGIPLRGRQGPTGPLLDPGNGLYWINLAPGEFTLEQPQEMRSYTHLSPLEGSQKQTGLPIDGFGDEVLVLAFELDRLLDDCHWDFQEGRRCLDELLVMDGTVAIFSKLLQHMTHPSL